MSGFLLAAITTCKETVEESRKDQPQMQQQNINTVMEAHTTELMALPGVVGVYIGLLDDEKTPCIKVMVIEKTPELESKIPASLDGYPVVIEETGVIRPLK